jgi:hypothetical protein
MEESLVQIREAYLAVFRATAPSRQDAAIGSLGGVYYSFKSERLVERLMAPLGQCIADEIATPNGVFAETAANAGDILSWLLESVLRSVHSSADLLSQSLNQVVLAKPMPPDDCYSKAIVDKLRSEARHRRRPGLDQTACALDAYLKSPEYLYIDAFVNVCKHQNFVHRAYYAGLNLDSELSTQVTLQEFTRRGELWPQKNSADIAALTGSLRCRALEILRLAEANAWRDDGD